MTEEIISPSNQQIKLSVSKAKTFLDCALKYKFAYIEKLPKKEWSFHRFGTFVHQVLEDFHQYYIDGGTDAFNVVMTRCFKKAIADMGDKMDKEAKDEAKKILTSYLKIITTKSEWWANSNVIAVEKDFNIIIQEKVLLNGFIDRVQKDEDGTLHVCDYKTSKSDRYLKNDPFQLLTYAYILCLEDPTIQKIRGSYIMLRHNFKFLTFDFSREDVMKVEDKFVNYAEQILSEKLFRAKPTMLCSYCDFLDNCTEGRAVALKDKFYGKTSW